MDRNEFRQHAALQILREIMRINAQLDRTRDHVADISTQIAGAIKIADKLIARLEE